MSEKPNLSPNIKDIYRLQDLILLQLERSVADSVFLSQRLEDDSWETWTYNEAVQCALYLAEKMRAIGMRPNDMAVLRVKSGPYWVISELAILFNRQIAIPSYTAFRKRDFTHIQAVTNVKYLLNDESLSSAEIAGLSWQVIQIRKEIDVVHKKQKEQQSNFTKLVVPDISNDKADEKTTACIIFTSGTSGNPRGVVLSHKALVNCVVAILKALYGTSLMKVDRHRFYSFLPLTHAYEHVAGLWLPIILGAEIFYPQSAETVVGDMGSAQPTLVTTVPRLFETLRRIMLKKLKEGSKLKLALLNRGLYLAKHDYDGWKDSKIYIRWVNKLEYYLIKKILSKIAKQRFGSNLLAFISGGATLHPQIEQLMMVLGVLVLNGYGLTEYSPTISCNLPEKNRRKSVGCALPGVDVKVTDEGEFIVKGDQIMDGYYNAPSATKQCIRDGYIYTGDIGYIDDDGYIFITDRKKDIIVTSGGENISPINVELSLELEPEISQAYVYGNNKPYLVAVLVADESLDESNTQTALQQAIRRVNTRLTKYQAIRFFVVADQEFSIANNCITPTLKLKRESIRKCYEKELEALYKMIK